MLDLTTRSSPGMGKPVGFLARMRDLFATILDDWFNDVKRQIAIRVEFVRRYLNFSRSREKKIS